MTETTRPLATEELEDNAKRIFPIEISAEEFVAIDGLGWMEFRFKNYRYQDPQLDAWIQEVGAILASPPRVEACRQKYLTEEQRSRLRFVENDLDDLEE